MADTTLPLEGTSSIASNFRAHLGRDAFWGWVVKITQLLFTVIALSLAIALVTIQLHGAAFSRPIFTIFATVFSQITWAYIFLFSFGTIDDGEIRMLSWLVLGFLNLLFYFSAATAMSTLGLGSSCSDEEFVSQNPLYIGSKSRCEIGQTCVAFLWLGMSEIEAFLIAQVLRRTWFVPL